MLVLTYTHLIETKQCQNVLLGMQQMMANPELMRQMMDSPIMQGIFNNPQIFQSMLTSNPQVQQLIEV